MWPFARKRVEHRSIETWPWGDDGGTAPHQHQPMNLNRALSLVPVFGAVRLLTDSVASLVPSIYKLDNNGVAKRLPAPPLFQQPSVHGTLVDWQERAVASMALQGDAIGLITARDYYGWPTMVEWLNPDDCYVQDGSLTGQGSYMQPIWWWKGRQMRTEDIVHIPWFSLPYRVRGLSPIGAFRATANVGLGAADYAASWFDNGGVPPGVFRNTKQTVSKEDADLITARVTHRLRSRKPLVHGSDWVYEPIAIKPHEAQFVETMRLTATQIAVIYGVPPEKIGGTTGTSLTYSTQEQNSLDFLTFSLRPWLVKLEAAFTRLFPRGTYVKYDTSDIIRVDAKTRAEIDQMSLGGQGWRTTDEVRADHDWGPIPQQLDRPKPPIQLAPNTTTTNGTKPLTAVGEN